MNELLTLPMFARIDEYAGPWLISVEHFAAILQGVKLMDMRAHIEEKLEPRAAAEINQAANGLNVAVVNVSGLLMKGRSSMGGTSTIDIRRDIRQAANNPDVAAIMLRIDSPGGTVAGTSDLAAEIQAAKKIKPVHAHIEDLGASAAYWAASQADRITANSPTALIGSIGTLQVVYDQSAAAEQQGVKTFLFATGPLKGMGTPGTKVTQEHVDHVQQLVDSIQTSFDAAVKKGRGLSSAELAAVRHGGVFTATAALDAKLIDAIQPMGKSINDLSRSLADSGRGRQRADAGPASVASPFPMAKLGMLPMRSE